MKLTDNQKANFLSSLCVCAKGGVGFDQAPKLAVI